MVSLSSVFQKLRKRLALMMICAVLVMGCLGVLWHHYGSMSNDDLISAMENRLLDLRFRFRGTRRPSGKIGILAIDEKSLQRFGRWPIARKYYEQAFKNLKKLGVNWIGFDVVWSEPERPLLEDVVKQMDKIRQIDGQNWKNQLKGELEQIDQVMEAGLGDQAIGRAIKSFDKIVMGYFYYASPEEAKALGKTPFRGLQHMLDSAVSAVVLPESSDLKDYSFLKAHGIVANTSFIGSQGQNFAFFNNESDSDAIMRWVTLVRTMDGHLMPSLSLKMAAQILGREIVVFFDKFGINDISLMHPEDDTNLIKIPTDHNGFGRILINHRGPGKTIPHFSLADAYDNSFSAKERQSLKGKNLILGPTAIAINDQRANPFDAGINGAENHAAVIDNILSKQFMRRSEEIYLTEMLIVLVVGLVFSPIMIFSQAAVSGLSAIFFLIGYYYFDKFFWFSRGEWVYMGMPFIEITSLFVSTTLYKYMTEEREKKKVKGAFGLYLSPDVINQVLDDPEALKLGGEKKELTVFFSDVRSFTTISESLTPEKLCELMNEYFTPMTGIVLKSKGVLDKYIGDAIMAFWGAPIDIPQQADVACTAALEMLYALDKLRVDLPKKGFPLIDIGIGLNTGPMSVGNMGSGERFCYTVMGDAVNLGARLESLTKEYGVKILISEFTRRKLTRKDLFVRDLDDIRVKGKLEPVKIFEILRPDLLRSENDLRSLLAEFEQGRLAYRQQDWSAARKHLTACMKIKPDDGPTELLLKRVESAATRPIIPDWDGVYTFKHK